MQDKHYQGTTRREHREQQLLKHRLTAFHNDNYCSFFASDRFILGAAACLAVYMLFVK